MIPNAKERKKKKKINWTISKLKTSVPYQESDKKTQRTTIYFQIIYLVRYLHPDI